MGFALQPSKGDYLWVVKFYDWLFSKERFNTTFKFFCCVWSKIMLFDYFSWFNNSNCHLDCIDRVTSCVIFSYYFTAMFDVRIKFESANNCQRMSYRCLLLSRVVLYSAILWFYFYAKHTCRYFIKNIFISILRFQFRPAELLSTYERFTMAMFKFKNPNTYSSKNWKL